MDPGLTSLQVGVADSPVLRCWEADSLLNLLERRLRVRQAMGNEPSEMRLLPGTDEIGYEVIGDRMAFDARGFAEIAMPGGFRRSHFVSYPIVR